MKEVSHIGGPILALLGTFIAAYGSYMMTRFYHRFGMVDFLRNVLRVAGLVLRGDTRTAGRILEISPALAHEEDKSISAAGLYILFIGFFVQGIGAILTLLDVLLPEARIT